MKIKAFLFTAFTFLTLLSHSQTINWDGFTFWESGEDDGYIINEVIGYYDPYNGEEGPSPYPTSQEGRSIEMAEGTQYIMHNKPAGIDAKVMTVSARGELRIRIRLRGKAIDHLDLNDEPNFKIEFLDNAFSQTLSADIVNSDPVFNINFFGETVTPPLESWNETNITVQKKSFSVVEFFCTTACSSCWYFNDWHDFIGEQESRDENILLISENYLEWSKEDEWFLDDQAFDSFTTRYHDYLDNVEGNWAYDLLVYDGSFHDGFRGDTEKIVTQINTDLTKTAKAGVEIGLHDLDEERGMMAINYEVTGDYIGKTLKIAVMENGLRTFVRDGESFEMDGVDYLHTNIVKSFQSVILPEDNSGRYTFFLPQSINYDSTKVVAFIQDNETMEILGATNGFDFVKLSVSNITNIDVEVYPNPTSDQFFFESLELENTEAELYDAAGKMVKSFVIQKGLNKVSVGELPKGNYFLKSSNLTFTLFEQITIK